MLLKINAECVFRYAIMILLPIMMIFISQLYLVKYILLLIIVLTVPKRFAYSKDLLFFLATYVLLGLWGILTGVIHATDNPMLNITTSVIYPLFFFPLVTQVKSENDYDKIIKIMFWAHVFIVVYDLAYAFSIINGYSFPNIYTIEADKAFTYYGEDGSRMNFINLNTITYTTPILFMLWLTRYKMGVNHMFQTLVLIGTLFLFLLSGRRSLILVFITVPFGVYLFKNLLPKSVQSVLKRTLLLFMIVIGCALLYWALCFPDLFNAYLNIFLNAFDSGEEPTKFVQNKVLIEAFKESPIMGHGDGAYFFEPFPGRVQNMHTMELSYQLALAQRGIVGLVLMLISYAGLLLYGAYLSYKSKDIVFLSFLFGLFFMLVTNATNPVMASFDLLIPLFLCWAKVNSTKLYGTKNI